MFWHSMQMVSNGDNLHEMSDLFSGKMRKISTPAELAQKVVKVKG